MEKYEKSFKVDLDEIPSKCPECGKDIDIINSVEYDYHPNGKGIYGTLYCNNDDCTFSKDLIFETHEDIAKDMDEFGI